jgi:archaemetzincin
MKPLSVTLVLLLLVSCGGNGGLLSNSAPRPVLDERAAKLAKDKETLTRFFRPMQVRDGDWLQSQPENGETFEEYLRSGPTLPTEKRKTIYVQPVGDFSKDENEVIRLTADYLRAFFNLPVVLRDRMPLGSVPDDLKRLRYPNNVQVRTTYFLDDLLPKILPDDAAALICLTSNDLYPGDTWNYVFGQASLEKRVGVWSLWRLGKDGYGKKASPELLLARTLKIAMHETGHMFSMRHCTKYECLMSGTNHLEETDRRPLEPCPECVAKVSWGMSYPLDERYKRLAAFWKGLGRTTDQRQMLDMAGALCGCKIEG